MAAHGVTDTVPDARSGAWARDARRARLLAWFSLVWMTTEGALGLLAGYRAGSTALVGWAFGSVVEGMASVIVVWRFTGRRLHAEDAERRAQRAVAVSFWLLAPYIAAEALLHLLTGRPADQTWLGIAVASASLLVMPALGAVKHRLARSLDSAATAGEGTQNYLCAAQAAAVLLALVVVAVTSAGWWLDPVVALLLAAWAVQEGREAWRGEDCC